MGPTGSPEPCDYINNDTTGSIYGATKHIPPDYVPGDAGAFSVATSDSFILL